jgi:uncharacterized protein
LAEFPLRVGLISDTHGLLRPQVVSFLEGSDHIIHAGDIGGPDILENLERIAPVTAVRGNNDGGSWADRLRETELLQVEVVAIHVIHDIAELGPEQGLAGIQVIVFGHSHKPMVEKRGEILYVNPGSAGPRRFRLPISAAELFIGNDSVSVQLHTF